MLGVVMLNVIMLSVVAPCTTCLVNFSFVSGCHKKYWQLKQAHLVTQPEMFFLKI
jgi:hypothetical protein